MKKAIRAFKRLLGCDSRAPRYVKANMPETFAELQRRAREEWEPKYALDAEEEAAARNTQQED